MKKHTGERPYRCDYCVMGFTQKSNMKLHMKRAHSFVGKNFTSEEPHRFTWLVTRYFPSATVAHFTVSVHHSSLRTALAKSYEQGRSQAEMKLVLLPCCPFLSSSSSIDSVELYSPLVTLTFPSLPPECWVSVSSAWLHTLLSVISDAQAEAARAARLSASVFLGPFL